MRVSRRRVHGRCRRVAWAGGGGADTPLTTPPCLGSTEKTLWGYTVGIVKEGVKQTDIGIQFDNEITRKHEWVGRGEDGMPVLEGKVDEIMGKNFEIWCERGRLVVCMRSQRQAHANAATLSSQHHSWGGCG